MNQSVRSKKESYKHYTAKILLAEWLREDYLRVDIESPFCMEGMVLFVPDITCYDYNGLNCIYEVEHKSGLTGHKLGMIQYYQHATGHYFPVYEVSADHILNQTSKPKKLLKCKMT